MVAQYSINTHFFICNNMDNNNIVVYEGKQEKLTLEVVPVTSTEQQELDNEASAKEWVRLNGFGVYWDIVTYSLFFLFESKKVTQQLNEKKSYEYFYVHIIFSVMILFFVQRFGPPGIFMSQQLKLYVGKSVTGMLIYLVIFLINVLSSKHIISFLTDGDSFFGCLLAIIYIFTYSSFLLGHGSTAMVLFPIKLLVDFSHPPHDSKIKNSLKFCSIVAIESWIYIAAVYQDKKDNHTNKVLAGESAGNMLAKDVIRVTHVIIIPLAKTLTFLFIAGIGCSIVVECLVQPAVAMVRRNRLVLPRHFVHFD